MTNITLPREVVEQTKEVALKAAMSAGNKLGVKSTDTLRILIAFEAALAAAEPVKAKFWRAGDPDCPPEIKAGNGELVELRCKHCGRLANEHFGLEKLCGRIELVDIASHAPAVPNAAKPEHPLAKQVRDDRAALAKLPDGGASIQLQRHRYLSHSQAARAVAQRLDDDDDKKI